MDKFNLIKAIRKVIEAKPFDSAEKRYFDQGRSLMEDSALNYSNEPKSFTIPLLESRAVLKGGTPGSGAEMMGVNVAGLLDPIRNSLVLAEAGAQILTELKGEVNVPIYAGTNAKWKGEGISSEEGAGAFSKVELKPKRITTYIDVDNKWLMLDSSGATEMLMTELGNACASKLESTIFGKEAGTVNQPVGLFLTAPTVKGTASRDNLLSLEQAITFTDKLRAPAYITNAKGRDALKRTPKIANSPAYLMESDGSVNGYKALITNNVATGLQGTADEEGIVFGDWSQLVIGIWGASHITIDDVTRALEDETRIHISFWCDYGLRSATAFKTGSLK